MSIWNMAEEVGRYEINQSQRMEWFKKIEPKGNWKLPIDSWIKQVEFQNCNEAARWFTGGSLEIVESSYNMIHVRGKGYYANIGA